MLDHIEKILINENDLKLTCTVCKYSENRMVKNQDVFKRFEKNFRIRHLRCGEKLTQNVST
jgi:hypothetical protein